MTDNVSLIDSIAHAVCPIVKPWMDAAGMPRHECKKCKDELFHGEKQYPTCLGVCRDIAEAAITAMGNTARGASSVEEGGEVRPNQAPDVEVPSLSSRTLNRCRAAFEKWMKITHPFSLMHRNGDEYEYTPTCYLWTGWQAAYERHSEISVIEPGEPDYKAMSSFELTAALGMDGRKWAQAFCQHTGFNDRGWAITWFCNAVMAGYDEACRRVAALDNKPPLIMREIGNAAPMALRNLVTLKHHKDKHGKDAFYEEQQPKAWKFAEQALSEIEVQK